MVASKVFFPKCLDDEIALNACRTVGSTVWPYYKNNPTTRSMIFSSSNVI